MAEKGIVFVVGAGPGVPSLLTVRGKDLLAAADAVVYERRSQRRMIPSGTAVAIERYYIGRRAGHARSTPADVAVLLVTLARKGLRVVYLAHGDPLAMGSGTELVTALNDSDIEFEVVPGVATANSAATYAGIPLLSSTLAGATIFATGRDPLRGGAETDWAAIARVGATLVVRNGAAVLPSIIAGYAVAGVSGDIPAAAIVHAGRPTQRTVVATLGTITDAMARASMMRSATLMVGWTVLLRDELAWFDTRPLFGVRIVLARQRYGASNVGERLRDLGAMVVEVPQPAIARLDLSALREAIDNIELYEWIVFATPDTVSIFWEQLAVAGRDSRALAGVKVACLDPATAGALLDRGITVDVVQDRFEAPALIDVLTEHPEIPGAPLLYVGEDSTAEPFGRELEEAGATVTALSLYREVPVDRPIERFRRVMGERHTDLVVALSPAAADEYVRAAGEHATGSVPAAAYDAATAHALQIAGIEVVITPSTPGTESLVAAIRARLGRTTHG